MSIASKKAFKPVPPEKGSFPLDHEGVCKDFMEKYMNCLKTSKSDNSLCREESKNYLDCRMKHNLMAQEEWPALGYSSDKLEKGNER